MWHYARSNRPVYYKNNIWEKLVPPGPRPALEKRFPVYKRRGGEARNIRFARRPLEFALAKVNEYRESILLALIQLCELMKIARNVSSALWAMGISTSDNTDWLWHLMWGVFQRCDLLVQVWRFRKPVTTAVSGISFCLHPDETSYARLFNS